MLSVKELIQNKNRGQVLKSIESLVELNREDLRILLKSKMDKLRELAVERIIKEDADLLIESLETEQVEEIKILILQKLNNLSESPEIIERLNEFVKNNKSESAVLLECIPIYCKHKQINLNLFSSKYAAVRLKAIDMFMEYTKENAETLLYLLVDNNAKVMSKAVMQFMHYIIYFEQFYLLAYLFPLLESHQLALIVNAYYEHHNTKDLQIMFKDGAYRFIQSILVLFSTFNESFNDYLIECLCHFVKQLAKYSIVYLERILSKSKDERILHAIGKSLSVVDYLPIYNLYDSIKLLIVSLEKLNESELDFVLGNVKIDSMELLVKVVDVAENVNERQIEHLLLLLMEFYSPIESKLLFEKLLAKASLGELAFIEKCALILLSSDISFQRFVYSLELMPRMVEIVPVEFHSHLGGIIHYWRDLVPPLLFRMVTALENVALDENVLDKISAFLKYSAKNGKTRECTLKYIVSGRSLLTKEFLRNVLDTCLVSFSGEFSKDLMVLIESIKELEGDLFKKCLDYLLALIDEENHAKECLETIGGLSVDNSIPEEYRARLNVFKEDADLSEVVCKIKGLKV